MGRSRTRHDAKKWSLREQAFRAFLLVQTPLGLNPEVIVWRPGASPVERYQQFLMPPSLSDWLPDDHLA